MRDSLILNKLTRKEKGYLENRANFSASPGHRPQGPARSPAHDLAPEIREPDSLRSARGRRATNLGDVNSVLIRS
jgi:hypothetical protein